MTLIRFKFFFLFFAGILPLAAHSTLEEVIDEKRIGVAMRMVGHEVLLCFGDRESRILPIEQIDKYYKISFEFEFGFDPYDIVSIIDGVMTETATATHYLVEIEQCTSKEVVHSFEIGNPAMIPCVGRILPVDCYSLLITILDGTPANANVPAATSYGYRALTAAATKASPLKFAFLMIPLLFLLGGIAYLIKEKNAEEIDPNMILIGATRFDQRNMVLSFENRIIELTGKEADLLVLLHSAANVAVARDVLLQKVWGDEGDYVGRTLDVFISKLRKKLEADAGVKIVNIRGVGYKLVMEVSK